MKKLLIITDRKGVKFRGRVEEEHIPTVSAEVLKKFPTYEVHTASILDPTPPTEDLRRRRRQYWCPYCASVRRFKQGPWGRFHCEFCGVSDGEFYVKIYNHLWE